MPPREPYRPMTLLDLGRGILSGLDWFANNGDEVTGFLENTKQHTQKGPWVYLIHHIPKMEGLALAFGVEAQKRLKGKGDVHVVSGLLEIGLLEPGFLTNLTAAIEKSSIGRPGQRQLTKGLEFLAERDYQLAVPLLITPLEGAFWRLAEQRELITRPRQSKKWRTTAKAGEAGVTLHAVEDVLQLNGLGFDQSFVDFAKALAYGGEGNAFRHGTADFGWQIRALHLEVALSELLEVLGVFKSQAEMAEAFARGRAAQDATREATSSSGSASGAASSDGTAAAL